MDRSEGKQNDAIQEYKDERFQLATAYVPYQRWGRLFPLDEALYKGTIFPDLFRPYLEER